MLELAFLLQQGSTAVGLSRFFAGLFLILFLYGGALTFTWWISKDE